PHAVVPAEPATDLDLEPAELEVAFVVDHEHLARVELVEPCGGAHRASRLVHVRLGLQERELVSVETDLRELSGELRAPCAAVPARELVDDEIADVVAVARVLAARVPEPDDEQVERRPLPAGPGPHGRVALRPGP